MFNFINRDHAYGMVFGVALISAVAFLTGCGDAEEDTADTAVYSTTTTETAVSTTATGTTTGTTTGTGTGTGTSTGT